MGYKQYDSETLSRLHRVMAMMLKDFNQMCETHGIEYFASWGTGIGALRHGGFIPWDDDIDLCLRRSDLERLREAVNREYADKYVLVDTASQKHYPMMNLHLCLKGTVFRDEPFKDLDCDLGIFLDLFPLDNVPDDADTASKLMRRAWLYNKLMIVRELSRPTITVGGLKGRALKTAVLCAHYVLVALRVSNAKLYARAIEAATSYNGADTKKVAFFFDTVIDSCIFDAEALYPLKKVPFENTYVWLPKNIDEYLRDYFGDYMQLPPKEQRKNHYPATLDFGPYAGM